jgi:hypothetical protein
MKLVLFKYILLIKIQTMAEKLKVVFSSWNAPNDLAVITTNPMR